MSISNYIRNYFRQEEQEMLRTVREDNVLDLVSERAVEDLRSSEDAAFIEAISSQITNTMRQDGFARHILARPYDATTTTTTTTSTANLTANEIQVSMAEMNRRIELDGINFNSPYTIQVPHDWANQPLTTATQTIQIENNFNMLVGDVIEQNFNPPLNVAGIHGPLDITPFERLRVVDITHVVDSPKEPCKIYPVADGFRDL